MKFKIISLLLILNISAWINPQKVDAQGPSVSYQVFYDELSPYGSWFKTQSYGYVWRPNVASDFTPYATNGHWILTQKGWTWVSDYPWGWAPFHYGRWYTDAKYGPMWVPGNEWGPGWVSWRSSSNYYGWAPIGPGGSAYIIPNNQWRFVRSNDFGRTNIYNYYISPSNNVVIIKNSKSINNFRFDKTRNITYNAGPDRIEVEKRGGKPINQIIIIEGSKPGQSLSKGQLQIYRPKVQKYNSAGQKPAPKMVNTSPQKANQPVKQQQAPSQKASQPVKKQTAPSQKASQPVKQQQAPSQKASQPVKQQQAPSQKASQPVKQQQAPSQKSDPHHK